MLFDLFEAPFRLSIYDWAVEWDFGFKGWRPSMSGTRTRHKITSDQLDAFEAANSFRYLNSDSSNQSKLLREPFDQWSATAPNGLKSSTFSILNRINGLNLYINLILQQFRNDLAAHKHNHRSDCAISMIWSWSNGLRTQKDITEIANWCMEAEHFQNFSFDAKINVAISPTVQTGKLD